MMDISPPPTTVNATATATTHVKNLDPPIQPKKDLRPPFANGLLKRFEPFHHHTPPPVVVSYRECLKNHAASTGGHVVDGCGEFMASPASTPTDPTSLKCAACGCHRNFHRREPEGSFQSFHSILNNPPLQHVVGYQPHHRHHPPPPPPPPQPVSPTDSLSPPPISSCYYPSAPQMLLALSSVVPENTVHHSSIPVPGGLTMSNSNTTGKKRFRTKFSEDQKEKMRELAERVGWKMQKEDEKMIIGFCNEIGVDKGVFKVWMHNHKMRFAGKKDSGDHLQLLPSNDSISSGGGSGNATATNGSSSSS